MLDPRFTDEILRAWQADQDHPYRDRAKRRIPEVAIVRALLDECFRASLRDEEGQPTMFSVALLADEDIDKLIGSRIPPLLRFEIRREFSAAALSKLASAFDPKLTTIVVSWNTETSRLEIWGTWLHAPARNRIADVLSSTNARPDVLTVISKGRAALTIARGDNQIGTLQAGYFVPATPTPFTSHSLGQHVHKAILSDPTLGTDGAEYWHFARDALEQILSEASLRGLGGTIVLLPSSIHINESLFASKYKLTGSFGLRQTLIQCMRVGIHHNLVEAMTLRKIANETIQRISQLTAVDGALIMNFDFEVLAFGATLTAPRTQAAAIIGPDGFGAGDGRPFEIDRYGTRHRSAMDFAASIDGSITFVISQDGPIRAFRRASEIIVNVWPDCTSSMFL